ncbi:Zn-dependent alcohol dehydrogenase [Catenovulum sediminis]|uniref:Zn-dependent alcohol dehydrogenase n=1 Tax=Catenovulum sediminis TaxID=1740262 RepID=A0ABV1REJ4_9ALTE|nr:Zn-dependent alcohol dehydrogenase [Catenovulum sediminis]
MLQSRAIISNGQGQFELTTVEVGQPHAGEVQVKIKASGICHTDWDSIQNWNKSFIVGHEGAGIVTAIGEGVTKVQVGDKVILNWAIPCGKCFQCLEGNVHICENHSPVCGCDLSGHAHPAACTHENAPLERSFHLGTMSEYTVVKEAAVVKTDVDISFPAASIVGCGVMTGWGSAVNAANVKAGSTVCVIGCGGVGLNVIQGAAISGAAKVIAIDISESRIQQAKQFGATHGVIAAKEDIDFVQVLEDVKALNGGRAADYAFECTAIPALGSAPLKLIRSAGVAVQASGIEQRIDFDCELFEWDKIYINPLYGQCNPERDFPRILSLFESGKLKLNELVTKTYTLETLAQGFDDMLNGRIAKGVVIIDSEDAQNNGENA